ELGERPRESALRVVGDGEVDSERPEDRDGEPERERDSKPSPAPGSAIHRSTLAHAPRARELHSCAMRLGEFEVLGELGRGASARVFRARSARGEIVAIKLL